MSGTATAAGFPPGSAGALLSIDLGAIAENWRSLQAAVGKAACAAVLKADAYGLGAARVAPALAAAGCRRFFVAHLDEALALKPLLPASATLTVLHGPTPGAEAEFAARGIQPVLNGRAQVDAWSALARRLDRELPAFVQVDSGMARLGLSPTELRALAADPRALAGIRVAGVMSHLACADDPGHPANREQLERFRAARRLLPPAPASFANSSAIFLGEDFHFDLVRPGAALYGLAPQAGMPNPMRPVVSLQARVIQCREIEAGAPVGYGFAWRSAQPSRIATVSVGYADGWLRSLCNRGAAWFDGTLLPLAGRVSMDTITLDASALPEGALRPGTLVELIGKHQDVDAVAARAGTIGYEILTSLGARYARRYLEAPATA
ncbi:alanine racemase [Azohydromonas aeria]|uniref:alanine racemase n=1 Tax=Azohydromonas aeria TaxID=2590212 RepID=UPI0012F7E03E|nr:alanine racemase [Azohydromonas aeria]